MNDQGLTTGVPFHRLDHAGAGPHLPYWSRRAPRDGDGRSPFALPVVSLAAR